MAAQATGAGAYNLADVDGTVTVCKARRFIVEHIVFGPRYGIEQQAIEIEGAAWLLANGNTATICSVHTAKLFLAP